MRSRLRRRCSAVLAMGYLAKFCTAAFTSICDRHEMALRAVLGEVGRQTFWTPPGVPHSRQDGPDAIRLHPPPAGDSELAAGGATGRQQSAICIQAPPLPCLPRWQPDDLRRRLVRQRACRAAGRWPGRSASACRPAGRSAMASCASMAGKAEADRLVDQAGLAEARIAVRLDGLPAEMPPAIAQRPAIRNDARCAVLCVACSAALQHHASAGGVRAMAKADHGQQPTARIAQAEPQPGVAAGAERFVPQDERPRLAPAQLLDRAGAQLDARSGRRDGQPCGSARSSNGGSRAGAGSAPGSGARRTVRVTLTRGRRS